MDSSHFLQRVIIKQKLLIIYTEKILPFQKWIKPNPRKQINLRQHRTLLYNRLKNTVDQQEINEDWEHIKTAITESSKETIHLHEKSSQNKRRDERCNKPLKKT